MERLRYLRLTGRQKVLVWCTFLLAALGALTAAAVLHMRPIVVDLATARTSNMVNRIVVAAINDAVDSGRIDYGRLVSFDKDANGHVTALKSNMAEFNRLQASISDDILQRMADVSTTDLSIPIGTLTGSPLQAAGRVCTCACSPWALPPPASITSFPPPASTRPATASCWMWMSTSASCCPG